MDGTPKRNLVILAYITENIMAVISNSRDNRTLKKQNLLSALCFAASRYLDVTKNVARSINYKIKLNKANLNGRQKDFRFWTLFMSEIRDIEKNCLLNNTSLLLRVFCWCNFDNLFRGIFVDKRPCMALKDRKCGGGEIFSLFRVYRPWKQ